MKTFAEYCEMRDQDQFDENLLGGIVGGIGSAVKGLGSGLWGAGKAALQGAGEVGKKALELGDKAISATAQPVIQGTKDFVKGTAEAYAKVDYNRLVDIQNKSTDPAFKLMLNSIIKNFDKHMEQAKKVVGQQQAKAQATKRQLATGRSAATDAGAQAYFNKLGK